MKIEKIDIFGYCLPLPAAVWTSWFFIFCHCSYFFLKSGDKLILESDIRLTAAEEVVAPVALPSGCFAVKVGDWQGMWCGGGSPRHFSHNSIFLKGRGKKTFQIRRPCVKIKLFHPCLTCETLDLGSFVASRNSSVSRLWR